ncbi:LarC family nickel insertion protein [Pseudodesulfovibrio tunisiensis]|uniref:LarC family nickel insertion protein n=1 Tax=Pseudodesulfovibrio tunisiensis TaxID=463192 RepID=UPI001FB4C050|nr:LarC family nickel insertion protein [Pseudodesulfovibrio tunisiensis]
MKYLYLDCSTGVSGDMLLASMAHALEELDGPGAGFDFLQSELARLGLDGFHLEFSCKSVSHISTRHVDVVQTKDQPLRTLSDLQRIIEASELPERAASRSLEAVELLARAEAKVHGVDVDRIHFHEIGAVDTIADICGSMVLAEALGVDRIVCSPVDLGSGFVQIAHGTLPVPAPACAELATGLAVFATPCGMERATPTGLAVLRTLADECGSLPLGTVRAVGYGSGGRSCDEQPTYVRAFVLESVAVQPMVREHAHG